MTVVAGRSAFRRTVPRDDDAFGQPLRPGRPHVVLVHGIHHARPDHPEDDPQDSKGQGDNREDEMGQRIPEDPPVAMDGGVDDEHVGGLRIELRSPLED